VTDSDGKTRWEDLPFGDYVELLEIVPQTTVNVEEAEGWDAGFRLGDISGCNFLLQDNGNGGKKYRVIWDGASYDCVSYGDFAGGRSGIGNSKLFPEIASAGGKGEPFLFYFFYATSIRAEYPGTHTFAIYEMIDSVRTLDPKYLPEIVPDGEPFQQLVTDVNGMMKWEDKPFGEVPLIEVRESESTYALTQHEPTGVYYLTVASVNNGDPYELLNDDRTHLRFNGVTYPLVYVHIGGSGSVAFGYCGNASIIDSKAFPDTGEPFAILSGAWFFSPYPEIYDFMAEVQFPIIVTRENYPRVAWETWGENVAYPIDSKFMPNEVPVIQSAQVGQAIVVKSVDENGKPSSWEAKDIGGMIVTIRNPGTDSASCDKTSVEIASAVSAGIPVIGHIIETDDSGVEQMRIANFAGLWDNGTPETVGAFFYDVRLANGYKNWGDNLSFRVLEITPDAAVAYCGGSTFAAMNS
jgi:hypothetical protein